MTDDTSVRPVPSPAGPADNFIRPVGIAAAACFSFRWNSRVRVAIIAHFSVAIV